MSPQRGFLFGFYRGMVLGWRVAGPLSFLALLLLRVPSPAARGAALALLAFGSYLAWRLPFVVSSPPEQGR